MDKLPDEILCRIFTEVNLEQLVREVTLVNRRFARIATPLLYEKVALERWSDTPGEQLNTNRRFLDTLVTSPHLASDARELKVGDWQSVDVYEKNIEAAPTSLADLSKILQAIPALASYPLDWQRKFGSDLLHSLPDAFLAAIISLLPKLQSLYLTTNHRYRLENDSGTDTFSVFTETNFNETLTMRLVELATSPAMATTSLFACLSKVVITDDIGRSGSNGAEGKPGWDANLISFFLRLPALKAFTGWGCGEVNRESTWICDEGASRVTSIHLKYCKLGADSLSRILRSCQALEIFTCSRYCRECLSEEVECNYNYTDIHHDLYRHRDSLHHLVLNSKSCSHSNIRDVDPMATLAALHKLKTLRIDEDVLFGWSEPAMRPIGAFVPADLEHLTIAGDVDYAQHDLYREIARFLLSSPNPPSIYLYNACIEEAEEISKQFSGIAIEENQPGPYCGPGLLGFCNFYMYKAEADQAG